MNAQATRLRHARFESHASHDTQVETRLVDLIRRELVDSPPAAPKDLPARPAHQLEQPFEREPPRGTNPAPAIASTSGGAPASTPRDEDGVRAQAAIELIDKIETFLKSSRPALALTLRGAFKARVEIERLGPRAIAMRIAGEHGPPDAELMARIRDELGARGLHLGRLSMS